MWLLPFWEEITGNAGAEEPRFIAAHHLHSLMPELKYMAIMRNPVDRQVHRGDRTR